METASTGSGPRSCSSATFWTVTSCARSLLWADRREPHLRGRPAWACRPGQHLTSITCSAGQLRRVLEVGAAIPWHASALGKAVAAYRDEPAQLALLQGSLGKLTGRTIVEPRVLRRALGTIKRSGVAVEGEEAVIGEAEVAAPVFDHDGHPVGAIGVAGPVERVLPEGRAPAEVVAAVKETARGLSRDIGGVRRFARRR
jgi:DNA-binding IclR family transcriptional regulator